MSVFSKLAASALLLLVCGAPLMACLAPNAQLTEEEKACCRDMAGECSGMEMAADHSCCQKIVPSPKDALVKQLAAIDDAAAAAAAIAAQGTLSPAVPEQSRDLPADRHPPPITPSSRAVLRI
jgi:hypothetical protein